MDEESLLLGLLSAATSFAALLVTVLALVVYRRTKTQALQYFALSWAFMTVFTFMEVMYTITDLLIVLKVEYSIIMPIVVITWFLFIDHVQKDEIVRWRLALSFALSGAMFFLIWNSANDMTISGGVITSAVYFDFVLITNIMESIMVIFFAAWAFTVFKKSPKSMKGRKTILVAGIFVGFMAVAFALSYVAEELVFLAFPTFIVGALIALRAFTVEPKLMSLLPYTVYKLIVTSKNGPRYYTKEWVESGIDDDMLAGLMSAIGTVVKNTLRKIKTGAISEIKMYKGVMLTEMRYVPINIVLIASRASASLRSSLEAFGEELTQVLYKDLYDKDGFAKEVLESTCVFTDELMNKLIDNHFKNVPSFGVLHPNDKNCEPSTR